MNSANLAWSRAVTPSDKKILILSLLPLITLRGLFSLL